MNFEYSNLNVQKFKFNSSVLIMISIDLFYS